MQTVRRPVGRCARSLGSLHAQFWLDRSVVYALLVQSSARREKSIKELIDQSMCPFPVGRIALGGFAYEFVDLDPEPISFLGAAGRNPRSEDF